jgi:hypothetical protein
MHGADGLVVGGLGGTLHQLARHCIIARLRSTDTARQIRRYGYRIRQFLETTIRRYGEYTYKINEMLCNDL